MSDLSRAFTAAWLGMRLAALLTIGVATVAILQFDLDLMEHEMLLISIAGPAAGWIVGFFLGALTSGENPPKNHPPINIPIEQDRDRV